MQDRPILGKWTEDEINARACEIKRETVREASSYKPAFLFELFASLGFEDLHESVDTAALRDALSSSDKVLQDLSNGDLLALACEPSTFAAQAWSELVERMHDADSEAIDDWLDLCATPEIEAYALDEAREEAAEYAFELDGVAA